MSFFKRKNTKIDPQLESYEMTSEMMKVNRCLYDFLKAHVGERVNVDGRLYFIPDPKFTLADTYELANASSGTVLVYYVKLNKFAVTDDGIEVWDKFLKDDIVKMIGSVYEEKYINNYYS
jgi:hypothetical protein